MKLKEGQHFAFIALARFKLASEKTAKEKKNVKLEEIHDGVA
jgi:hypothetical protein